MSQYDFQNFLTHSSDNELLVMIETCFTTQHLKSLTLSQPKQILNKIRKEFRLTDNYEVVKLIRSLNSFEFSDILKKYVSRDDLIKELDKLNAETKAGLIKYYMSRETDNIILKLRNLDRVFESKPSIYSKILTLNDQVELCNEAILVSKNIEELIEHRIKIKDKINNLVLEGISKELSHLFKLRANAKPKNELPEKINIHTVFKKTIVFDFPVKRGLQEVIFNGIKLEEGNYFCIIWLSDLIGFDDAERFITLYHYKIESISPLINEMYVYDTTWNGIKTSGVLFIQGEEVLEPRYSVIKVISEQYFKAYRINPNKEKDENEQEIVEGWQYYNKNGKRLHNFEEI